MISKVIKIRYECNAFKDTFQVLIGEERCGQDDSNIHRVAPTRT